MRNAYYEEILHYAKVSRIPAPSRCMSKYLIRTVFLTSTSVEIPAVL